MKKILIIIMAVASLTACKNSFLDLHPISQNDVNSFYKTPNDINQAVNSAYGSLQANGEYGKDYVYIMEVSTDNSTLESITNGGGIYGDFDLYRVTASNPLLDEAWKTGYAGIQRCNIVLNRIDKIQPMADSVKAIRKGEVKFLRALTYFNMVRIWGNIPLVTTETTDPNLLFNQGPADVSSIYNQIITDLTDASSALLQSYPSSDAGRATSGAAQSLLGKVYLTLKNYPMASQYLGNVINSKTYSLLPNYADIFNVITINNKESIFEVQYIKGGLGEGSAYANLFAPAGDKTLTGGVGATYGDNKPTADLVNAYEAGDTRKPATIGSLADGRLYNKKYLDKPFLDSDAGNHFFVLRYADVLLMQAESLNETSYDATDADGHALFYLNTVRVRAGLKRLIATDLPDQVSFRKAIEKERRVELSFENHRWFDLVRTGRTQTVLNAGGGTFQLADYRLVYPIPQSQLDANPSKIIQNPGY